MIEKPPPPAGEQLRAELRKARRSSDVLAMEGGFSFDQRGLEVYKLATVRIYSKQTEIETGDSKTSHPRRLRHGLDHSLTVVAR